MGHLEKLDFAANNQIEMGSLVSTFVDSIVFAVAHGFKEGEVVLLKVVDIFKQIESANYFLLLFESQQTIFFYHFQLICRVFYCESYYVLADGHTFLDYFLIKYLSNSLIPPNR